MVRVVSAIEFRMLCQDSLVARFQLTGPHILGAIRDIVPGTAISGSAINETVGRDGRTNILNLATALHRAEDDRSPVG